MKNLLLLVFLITFGITATAQAQVVLLRQIPRVMPRVVQAGKVLPKSQIDDLAKLAHSPGELGKAVGRLNLDEVARVDTFLRVAITNGVIKHADELPIRQMTNTKGLASLLSKVNSSNLSQAKGHIKELQIGVACKKRGGKVLEFGRKFGDDIKKGDTDLDVFVEMNGKKFAIESKAYASEIPTDMVRADIKSLKHFCTEIEKGTKPIFCFDVAPPDIVQRVLRSENIPFLTGTGEEICSKLALLAQ